MKTIFWIGDSTCQQNSIATYPQTGIAQMFDRYVKRCEVVISNHALNGRSTKSFLDEGRFECVREAMREGDYLFIQFGHNDEKQEDATRYCAPDGAYADNLALFIRAAREKGAKPVLITPLCRRLFPGNTEAYRHTMYAASCRRVAERMDVPCIDLTAMSEQAVASAGESSKAYYMNLPAGMYANYPDGQTDNTHLQPLGAMVFGGLIARALLELGGEYAQLIEEEAAVSMRTGSVVDAAAARER